VEIELGELSVAEVANPVIAISKMYYRSFLGFEKAGGNTLEARLLWNLMHAFLCIFEDHYDFHQF
jgi:hypothetical protein